MADFPYTQVTGKLKSFFDKIQQVGKPDTVDKKWLASIGMKNSSDFTIIRVLKFIGFVDQSNQPTARWTNYRDKNRARKILAEGIRDGYADLFQTYHDAHRRNDEDLRSFFSTRTTAGSQALSKTVLTFKALCALADFEDITETGLPTQTEQVTRNDPVITPRVTKELGAGVTLNINIQLTLPATTDENVYDKLFAAMKRNLLS